MSLKFPMRLAGKRASSGGDVPFATSLYDSGDNLLVSIETDIPNSWNSLFAGLPYNATRLEIGTSCTIIGNGAFSYNSNLTGDLFIPDSVTTIEGGAFYLCGFDGTLTIGNSVTTIENAAFYGCTNFTGDIVIPDSVTSIGGAAFQDCGFDGSLTIGNGVTVIGNSAFYICSGLTGTLTIGNSVTSIEKDAFHGCSGLTGDLVIPDSVTNIGDYAFLGCAGLTGDLVIPNSVTSIGDFAFGWCSSLTTAYLATPYANIPTGGFGSGAFYDSGLTTVYAKDAAANGWTIGAGQTVGGKTGVTVAEWTNYPNPIP